MDCFRRGPSSAEDVPRRGTRLLRLAEWLIDNAAALREAVLR
jgi:hypothetical protein